MLASLEDEMMKWKNNGSVVKIYYPINTYAGICFCYIVRRKDAAYLVEDMNNSGNVLKRNSLRELVQL